MRKKIGTVVAVRIPELAGEVYVAESGALTDNIGYAKTYRASKKVLETIAMQAKVKYAPFKAVISTIEKWEEI
jgi:hypothetical protein